MLINNKVYDVSYVDGQIVISGPESWKYKILDGMVRAEIVAKNRDVRNQEVKDFMALHGYNKEAEPVKANIGIGRNDLCRCGSGKKFKRCCIRKKQ